MDKDAKALPTVADVEDEDVSSEIYLGVVKSYNDRRGFGFLACTETADQFGRDVYMPKAEATMAALLAAGIDRDTAVSMVLAGNTGAAACSAALAASCYGPEAAKAAAAATGGKEEGEKSSTPRLAEEDLVFFRVRKSVEGYPQAVCVQRLRKLTGSVVHPPHGRPGLLKSEEAIAVCGRREVFFDAEAAGQLRAIPGDLVTFCIPEAEKKIGVRPSTVVEPYARMVCLLSSSRTAGTVLGCFFLELPRTRTDEMPCEANLQLLQLPCHAFGDKLVLAGLPPDLDEAELMKFFSKQGANSAIVAHARSSSFASVTFSSTADVSRFLSRVAHAYADDKGTLIARLLPKEPKMEEIPTLPALPAPTLSTDECTEAGSLVVRWSPLVLALSYTVELRPVGTNSSWSSVDVTSKKLGAASRFDSNCSECVVKSLQSTTSYEARVSYFTNCNTKSEASDPSKPSLPSQEVKASSKASSNSAMAPTSLTTKPEPSFKPYTPLHTPNLPHFPPWWTPDVYDPAQGATPSWRSPSGLVVPAPAAPELCPADEHGFSLSVRWPAVLQAAAYVVELREAGTTVSERFTRTAPEAKIGTLVELRVGGLRPGPAPGRIYEAQVRTVGADGWESVPSPPGKSVPLPAETASSLSADAAPWQPVKEAWWPPEDDGWGSVPPPPVAPPTLNTLPEENATECLILD